jgi:hypothetical protein
MILQCSGRHPLPDLCHIKLDILCSVCTVSQHACIWLLYEITKLKCWQENPPPLILKCTITLLVLARRSSFPWDIAKWIPFFRKQIVALFLEMLDNTVSVSSHSVEFLSFVSKLKNTCISFNFMYALITYVDETMLKIIVCC